MAIETFEFIDDLNAANPTATDNVSEGDDHLRGLKTTLKNTFPNVTGAINATETELNILDGVTATTAELNYVDGVTSNIQTQLGTKLPLAGGTMTGTIAGFTSTGIDDNATSTAITIDASERVGINSNSPATFLEVKAGSNSVTDYPITVLNSAESVTTGYGAYGIDQSASSQYTIDVHDDLVIKSNTGENLRVLENGGLTFNGDTAAANALDDYEEGTFTPVWQAGSSDASYTHQVGTYTKIGNKVHVQGRLLTSSLGTMAGSLKITGLPFTQNGTSQNYGAGSIGWAGGLAITAGSSVTIQGEPGSNNCYPYISDLATGYSGFTAAELSANGDIIFSYEYTV